MSVMEAVDFDFEAYGPEHECGVVAGWGPPGTELVKDGILALEAIQHRGDAASGSAVFDRFGSVLQKDLGTVASNFPDHGANLEARLPLAHAFVDHVWYSTTGGGEGHPFRGKESGIKVAHNGTVIIGQETTDEYRLTSENDTENVTDMLDQEYVRNGGDLAKALKTVSRKIDGGYSLVISDGNCVIGARDGHGFRPLCLGERAKGGYIFASETVSLDAIGARFMREVRPGEMIVIDNDGIHEDWLDVDVQPRECIFEDLYFMNRESRRHGETIEEIRHRIGVETALEYLQACEKAGIEPAIDCVVGVPESALDGARGFADTLGVELIPALIKNPDYKGGRTYTLPTQAEREAAANSKYFWDPSFNDKIKEKRVAAFDDSIVRGTTVNVIGNTVRKAGAAEVHFFSGSPPIIGECFYGIHMRHEPGSPLLIVDNTLRGAARKAGVDSISFLSLEGIVRAKSKLIGEMCVACFNLDYPTETPVAIIERQIPRDRILRY